MKNKKKVTKSNSKKKVNKKNNKNKTKTQIENEKEYPFSPEEIKEIDRLIEENSDLMGSLKEPEEQENYTITHDPFIKETDNWSPFVNPCQPKSTFWQKIKKFFNF